MGKIFGVEIGVFRHPTLKSIEYSVETFIELSMTKSIDSDIREFKEDLKQALRNLPKTNLPI